MIEHNGEAITKIKYIDPVDGEVDILRVMQDGVEIWPIAPALEIPTGISLELYTPPLLEIPTGISLELLEFDVDYQAVLDYATLQGYTLPSPEQQAIQNDLVLDLKTAAVWDTRDILYVPANNGSVEFARINWKDPSAFELTQVGNVTWITDEGFRSDDSTSGHNTGWNVQDNAVNFTVSSADTSIFIFDWHDQSLYGVGFPYGGRESSSTSQFHFYVDTTERVRFRTFTTSVTDLAISDEDTQDFISLVRDDNVLNSYGAFFKNGIELQDNSTVQNSLGLDIDWYIGALNTNGTIQYSWRSPIGFMSNGSSTHSSMLDFSNAVNNYMIAIGS